MKILRKISLGSAEDWPTNVTFSPAGDLVLATGGAWGGTGRLDCFDAADGRLRARVETRKGLLDAIACSPDGRFVALGFGEANVIDVHALPSLVRIAEHPPMRPPFRELVPGVPADRTRVGALAFDPEGRRLAAGCWDCSAKIFDLDGAAFTELRPPARENVDFIAWSPDGGSLATGSATSLLGWAPSSACITARLKLDGGDLWRHVGLPDGGRVASLSRTGRLRTCRPFDPGGPAVEEDDVSLPGIADALTFGGGGDPLLGIALDNGVVAFWRLASRALAGKVKVSPRAMPGLSLDPTGPRLAAVTFQASRPALFVMELAVTENGGEPKTPKKAPKPKAGPSKPPATLVDFLSTPRPDQDRQASGGERTDWLPLATLEVTTGSLWAGDPLLPNAEDGCVAKVAPGSYLVEGIGVSRGRNRFVGRLRVRPEAASPIEGGEVLGETGTDSAMIGICDVEAFATALVADENDDPNRPSIEVQTAAGHGVIRVGPAPARAEMPFAPTGGDGVVAVVSLRSGGRCVGMELNFEGQSPGR